jgi:hypothetical protein
VHLAADVHDTPDSWAKVVLGLGVSWMVRLLPFHRSASVLRTPGLSLESPTAVQAVAELHDTANRSPPLAPAGLAAA